MKIIETTEAYLIVQVSKREGELLTLRDTSDTEVEPGFIVVYILYVWFTILRHP